ncbi:hypothetical protein CRG98_005879 [Punica granatum]|uniref:DUF7745 domain-containing protein n=1 Tax=Punica granatum TaxID=22663 RepID=A0A2I0KZH7_PUNGR|nr:hypothetical protein CRG98_005879 [Punica granatum]
MATHSHVCPSRVPGKVRMDRPAPGLRLEAITPPRQDIMRIWRTLRPVDHAFIRGIIGDMRDACHGFLLLVFGTLLFLYSPNLVDGAIAQVVLQAVRGNSYVEALLAETVRSLDYVREIRRDRIRGSPHLLQIWLLAHIRPFCSSHPFSYIADERSLIERLVPVIPPPEHRFSEWRRFWRELTPTRFLWVARWNPGGPMITGCPGIGGVPLLSHLGSMLIFPGRIREIRRQRDASTIQRLYFPEHPTDEERAFSATSAYVARFYLQGSTPPQRSQATPTPRASSTLAPEAESSIQAAMHAELRAIREERDRLRCELVDSHAEVLPEPLPISIPIPATAYTAPPPMVFPVPSAPAPIHLQATELPPYPSLQPHVALSHQVPPPINTTFHEPGTPIHAAQFASPTHFFPEADAEQERRLKRMEETIRALQAGDARPDARYGDGSLFPGMRLPPKFKVPEFKTYEGTTDPRHHLRHYRGKMLHYWEYEEFVIHSFQDSLSGSALDWFMSRKAEDIPTWEDLSRKFIDQYRYCAETPPTLLELSTKEMAQGQRSEGWKTPASKGEESSKKIPAKPSSSGGRRENEVSVNAVNTAHQASQQYSVNLTTTPTTAPTYFPPPPQHQPQSIYYSAPPVPPPATSQSYDHYTPATAQPSQPRPPVSRTPPPAQQNPTAQGPQVGSTLSRPRKQYMPLPAVRTRI